MSDIANDLAFCKSHCGGLVIVSGADLRWSFEAGATKRLAIDGPQTLRERATAFAVWARIALGFRRKKKVGVGTGVADRDPRERRPPETNVMKPKKTSSPSRGRFARRSALPRETKPPFRSRAGSTSPTPVTRRSPKASPRPDSNTRLPAALWTRGPMGSARKRASARRTRCSASALCANRSRLDRSDRTAVGQQRS